MSETNSSKQMQKCVGREGNYEPCECHPIQPTPFHSFWEDLLCDWCGINWFDNQTEPTACEQLGKKRRLKYEKVYGHPL